MGKAVLPIYKSAEDLDQPKSSLQEVFDLVVSDLTARKLC
jgi:hypothetical protein